MLGAFDSSLSVVVLTGTLGGRQPYQETDSVVGGVPTFPVFIVISVLSESQGLGSLLLICPCG